MDLGWNSRMHGILATATPILQSANNCIPYWEAYNQSLERYQQEYNELRHIRMNCEQDLANLKASLTHLQNLYSRKKTQHLLQIKEEINRTVNLWYNNTYDFRFYRVTERGVVKTNLKDLRRGGNLEHVCGGAVKQTVSVLFDVIFIKSSGGRFIFLDEAFNSLGEKEVETLPDVLIKLDRMQIALIEHKCMVIPDEFAVVVNVSRDIANGTRITVDDPNGFLEDVRLLLSSQGIIEEDIELLRHYDFSDEQISQLVATRQVKSHESNNYQSGSAVF